MTKNSLNIDKKAAFKKRIHLKYDYLLEQRGKLPKAKADNSLFEGVNQCVRKHSDTHSLIPTGIIHHQIIV